MTELSTNEKGMEDKMKLKAENEIERRVLEYVLANASPDLMKRINDEGKTIQKCWKYVTFYARKHAKNLQYCMTDEEAFGLVMHYFEDESEGATYDGGEDIGQAEAERASRNQAKCERAEAKRMAAEARARAKEMQLTLFDGI